MKTMEDIDRIYKSEMNRARLEGESELVLRLLKRRVGNVSNELETQIKALPLVQLEELGEALLDFTSLTDLEAWFDR